jgi:hypothetical protein
MTLDSPPDQAQVLADAAADLALWQAELPEISYTGALTRVDWTQNPPTDFDFSKSNGDPSPNPSDGKCCIEIRNPARAHLWLERDTDFDFYLNNQSATLEIIQFDENGSAIVSYSDTDGFESPNPQPPISYVADGTLDRITLKAGATTLYLRGGTFLRYDPSLWVTWEIRPESPLWIDQSGPKWAWLPTAFEGAAFPWRSDGDPRVSVILAGAGEVRRDHTSGTREPGTQWTEVDIEVDPTTPNGGFYEIHKNTRGFSRIQVAGYCAVRADRLSLPSDLITEEGLTVLPAQTEALPTGDGTMNSVTWTGI